MKKIIFLVLISSFMFCNYTKAEHNYKTQCVTVQNDGYITIKIWNTSCGRKYSDISARKDAIHAILYSGFSESNGCQTQHPILNSKEIIEKFKKIEQEFFSKNGKWNIYIRSSSIDQALPITLKQYNLKVYEVSISKNELRKYLEELKIIKSLNNGF